MATRLNTTARNAAVDAIAPLVDAGTSAGVLRIYTGTQPAGPGTTASGTLLAGITLADPAFGAGSSGVATLDNTPALSAVASGTGTAGWCRILTSTEAAATGLGVIDGAVTATGGGGELELSATALVPGITVEVTGGTLTMPAST